METKATPGLEEAIREVFAEGRALEYCDVVREVRERYGLRAPEALVERLYLDWKRGRALPRERAKVTIGLNPVEALPRTRSEPLVRRETADSNGSNGSRPVGIAALLDRETSAWRFVEAFGGFAPARAALDRLESAWKRAAAARDRD